MRWVGVVGGTTRTLTGSSRDGAPETCPMRRTELRVPTEESQVQGRVSGGVVCPSGRD